MCPENDSDAPHTGVTWFPTGALRTEHERDEHPYCVSPYCNVGAYYKGIDDAQRRYEAACNDEPAPPAGRLSTTQQWKEARKEARRPIVADERGANDDDDNDTNNTDADADDSNVNKRRKPNKSRSHGAQIVWVVC